MPDIARNLESIRNRIEAARHTAGRVENSITLVAVSKGKTEEDIRAAIAAGQHIFGENRVQEAQEKFQDLRTAHPVLQLHLIGPLQTNKAEDAVALFDTIESLDRPKLAVALAKAVKKIGRKPECYIEINAGGETHKAGIEPQQLEPFLQYCRNECSLTVTGLMCIPPRYGDPASYFTNMKKLAERHKLAKISMGMSNDFEVAIRCGATHVRIGTAIFGEREINS